MKLALIITGCIVGFEFLCGLAVFLIGAWASIEPVDIGDTVIIPQWCDRCTQQFALDGCDLCDLCITTLANQTLNRIDEEGCND